MGGESVAIRKAEASELDEIVRMHVSLQKHLETSNSSLWKYTEDKKWSLKQQYAEHLVDENSLILVAEMEGRAVGFVVATVNSRTEYVPKIVGNLSSLYVRRKYRRRGIGSRLIREACSFFASKKAEHIYVRCVLGNSEGEGFWKHLQFEPILVTAGTPRSMIEDRVADR